VRLSGKNATDQTGDPGPTGVCSSLRALRSMIATEPRMPAAATSAPSREIASVITGVSEACTSPRSSPAATRNRPCHAGGGDLAVGRDRHGVERCRQIVNPHIAVADVPNA